MHRQPNGDTNDNVTHQIFLPAASVNIMLHSEAITVLHQKTRDCSKSKMQKNSNYFIGPRLQLQ